MSDPVIELAERGRLLAEADRVRLVDLLLTSVAEGGSLGLSDTWESEIERRISAHRAGLGVLHDMDDVLEEARQIAP